MRLWRRIIEILTQDHWDFVNQNYWDFMIKIIEILTQNRRDFNTKIIEILTLKSWFQPDIFKIPTRNVRCLDRPEIPPPLPPPPKTSNKRYRVFYIKHGDYFEYLCNIFFFIFFGKNFKCAKIERITRLFFYWIRK